MVSYSIINGLVDLRDRLMNALERPAEFGEGARIKSNVLFSPGFMNEHTQFESFAGFYEHGPWTQEFTEVGGFDDLLEGVSLDEVDQYVAETTRFSSWELMRTRAAEDHILDNLHL